jgi:hypothetical protein
MPITNEGKQICDGCGKNIDEQLGGCQCPFCERLFCSECEAKAEIIDVLVNPHGPDYKKYELMCKICYRRWKEKNAKPGTLDGYLQTEAY